MTLICHGFEVVTIYMILIEENSNNKSYILNLHVIVNFLFEAYNSLPYYIVDLFFLSHVFNH